ARLVVERDVPRDDRDAEREAGIADPLDPLRELPGDLGLLRVAVVEAVGDCERLAAGARDVARRLEDRRGTAEARVETTLATGGVERDGESPQRRAQAQDCAVEPGPAHGARADDVVVALVDPAPRADVVRAEQVEQHLL